MRTVTALVIAIVVAAGVAACGPSADTKGKDKKAAAKGAAQAPQAKAAQQADPAAARAVQGKVYSVVGVIREIDMSEGTVTIDHESVRDLDWPAATRTFSVPGALLPKLAAGRKVEFEFVRRNNENVVTALK